MITAGIINGIWNYYLSLEKDLDDTSRYIEPKGQENVFSFEFAKLLVLSCTELERNRQISRRIKKHLWLSNRSWARDVHSFGILHSWGALAGKSCSAQASSIWLIAGAFRRTQSK